MGRLLAHTTMLHTHSSQDGVNVMVLPPVDSPEAAAGLLERVAAAEGDADNTRCLSFKIRGIAI